MLLVGKPWTQMSAGAPGVMEDLDFPPLIYGRRGPPLKAFDAALPLLETVHDPVLRHLCRQLPDDRQLEASIARFDRLGQRRIAFADRLGFNTLKAHRVAPDLRAVVTAIERSPSRHSARIG